MVTGLVYPEPPESISTPVTLPVPSIIVLIIAPEPLPLRVNNGAEIYPEPASVMVTSVITPSEIIAVTKEPEPLSKSVLVIVLTAFVKPDIEPIIFSTTNVPDTET